MNCREWTYLLLTLLLLTFSTIGFAMFAAFFPPAMVGLGLHQTYIAPIFSSFTIGNIVFSIASAPLATRFGRRPILRLGVAAVSAGSLLFGLVPDLLSEEMPMVLLFSLARCVQGGGGGLVNTVAMSTLSDQFPKDKGKVLGMASSSGAMAFFVGPPVGGVLFELGGFRLPFILAAVLPPICCTHADQRSFPHHSLPLCRSIMCSCHTCTVHCRRWPLAAARLHPFCGCGLKSLRRAWRIIYACGPCPCVCVQIL
jgi:MFS family permease